MIDLKELNGGKRFTYDTTERELKYEKLADTNFNVAIVRSVYINHGGIYGDSSTAIVSYLNEKSELITIGVNLPKHQNKNIERILDDDDTIDAINRLGLAISKRKYRSKAYNKDCYTVEWLSTPKDLKQSVTDKELPF